MDNIFYKNHSVQVLSEELREESHVWIVNIDGKFVGPPDNEKSTYNSSHEACQAGLQFAMSVIDSKI